MAGDSELSTHELNLEVDSIEISSSISNNIVSAREILKQRFKPKFQIRKIKNNGAILVLVWSFLLTTVYYYISYNATRTYSGLIFALIQTIVGVTLPIAGWLADVRFGRYKIICLSIWVMWISSLLLTAILAALQLLNLQKNNYHHKLVMIWLVPLGIGYGGFQANIIQFGVDQLLDASSNEIVIFITWYSWSYISSTLMLSIILQYISKEYTLLGSLLICVNISLAVVLIFLFKNVLIKEPVTQNPFKLVYKVIKYALKTKSPRQRSAFTYCEDDLPSRIDFGKIKYGGPFTTEQVEDVKTLFRVVLVTMMGCALFGMANEEHSKSSNLRSVFLSSISPSRYYNFSNFYYIIGTLLIPLNEFFLQPLFSRCLPSFKSYWKFLLGFFLRFVRYAVLLVIISYFCKAQSKYDKCDQYSSLCIL